VGEAFWRGKLGSPPREGMGKGKMCHKSLGVRTGNEHYSPTGMKAKKNNNEQRRQGVISV